ncbi:hypothetical protein NOVOSPHI9U_800008 [Novosphingobium sp. 9U]|nr:hypothetical protein NOVOSPHI9U_800008 [Novosphingobium sp. 9U]
MWTDWVEQSRKLLEHACDPNTGTPAGCAEMADQLRRIEQLEQWVLAFFSGMAFVAVWRIAELVWEQLRGPDPDEVEPAADHQRTFSTNGGPHDA